MMRFFITADEDGYLRIEEECEAAITLNIADRKARILSIVVPSSKRRQGVGSALLCSAEAELISRGIRSLEADFSSGIQGMPEFFEKEGFEVIESDSVLRIDTKKLLSSGMIKNTLKAEMSGGEFVAFEELGMDRWDELFSSLSALRLHLSQREMNRFSRSMSGVVFDPKNEIRSVILVSESEEGVHIDFLLSFREGNADFERMALQGMLAALVVSGGAKEFPGITYICGGESVTKFLGSALPEKPGKAGAAIFAKKELSENAGTEERLEEDLIGNAEVFWLKECKKVPFQLNICRKMPRIREIRSGRPVFRYELEDPLDIRYGIRWDEDENEGLREIFTKRITAGNLMDYQKILPADAVRDLPRPAFRGLLEERGPHTSYLIYELKDREGRGLSEIRWIGLDGSGSDLFSEYENEVTEAGVVKSTIETDPGNKEALAEAGFETELRESREITVTVGELMKFPFLSMKVPDFIQHLSEIGARQFKRGIGCCMLNGRKGLLEDLGHLPVEWFDGDVSSVLLTDGTANGMLLVHQLPSHRLSVDLLFSAGGDSQINNLRLIIHSIRAAGEKYPEDTVVILRRHNEAVQAITNKLFPGKKGRTVLYGERKEG
ncbi:MAG: GNAT family N-acetyltransferase [Lachnospiraceae bacterium]|nr:GNAT family N-acetyltransferase [Lachnospiraceae bacterium]